MSKYVYIGNGGSNYVFATYWETVSTASGTVSITQGGTVKLDSFQGLEDAVVSSVTFRDIADTKDRIEADMTGSERTTITIDET